MLDEMSVRHKDIVVEPPPKVEPAGHDDWLVQSQLREAVAQVLTIESEKHFAEEDRVAEFTGTLLLDPDVAYAQLDAALTSLDHMPLFQQNKNQAVIEVIKGRIITPAPRPWWPNTILLVLTILSLLYVGTGIALGEALLENPQRQLAELWRGWPYALSLVLILGTHELGHYFAARRHGVDVTLPYFIPFPFSFFGTLGAFIQLCTPMLNRRALLDIGAAGPLAGLAVAVPILLIGLLTADVQALPVDTPYLLEGNSVLYALSKMLVFGRFLPDGRTDVFLNQLTQAGWTGLFVTGLNLLPVGQLDGGHVMYALIGKRARLLYFPAILMMGLLAFFVSEAWWLWIFLLIMFGRIHATPLNDLTPLDNRRRLIAVAALLVFVLVFVPNPLRIVDPGALPPVDIY
ncbi:site-2 protease family protein [Chloroflexota bacterium]